MGGDGRKNTRAKGQRVVFFSSFLLFFFLGLQRGGGATLFGRGKKGERFGGVGLFFVLF